MKFVMQMGGIWSLTNRQYRHLVEYIAAGGKDVHLYRYGTHLGNVNLNVTDLERDNVADQCRQIVSDFHRQPQPPKGTIV
jgi:predicted SpoU family rRNA methylase